MSDFAGKLAEREAGSLGDHSNNRGERVGSKVSLRELLTLESGIRKGSWNSIPSAWKPVWYTGWHAGVLACTNSVLAVLLINVSLTIYVATNPDYKMEGGIGTLYSGSCDKSKKIGMWLHLGINILSTLLLAGSNYTQQCLAAPTRSEIDAAHARRRWMDIGVPSVRNLFKIKRERTFLWITIGITSIPLHLLYNSAVYNSLATNGITVTAVTNNHFEPGAYSNITEELFSFYQKAYNFTDWADGPEGMDREIKMRSGVLKEYNSGAQRYQDLTPSDCVKFYDTDFLSDRGNLFLITEHSSNATHNNTILDMVNYRDSKATPTSCSLLSSGYVSVLFWVGGPFRCNFNKLASDVAGGLPLRVELTTGDAVEISGCKSERTKEKCKVQFSLGIMIAVICCNLVKVCCMITAIVRSQEPTLVTLGDAVGSFLTTPDPTTMGMCFADRQFVQKEWRRGSTAGPRQWKQKGVKRWWTSVSITRWLTCNFLCLITVTAAGALLRMGMLHDAIYFTTDIKSMWTRGFGNIKIVSTVAMDFSSLTEAILLANLPQTILSFLYLTYNSLFTCMLSGHEWSLFSRRHRTLRVTSPLPGQRSTYWLQIPYTYAIPLMALSSLLHWLTSQSLFLVRVEKSHPVTREAAATISAVGYSCIAILLVLTLGILALLAAAGMGYRPSVAETTTVGSCSAAISAACHSQEDSEAIIGRKLRWGDVGIIRNLGVRHLTFSSEEGVEKPMLGEIYAGAGEARE